MTTNPNLLGQTGEQLATEHLTRKGYTILERNYRWKHAEIDIICEMDDTLIVVEVKTRNTNIYGEPYEAVTRSKQRQIIRVTNEYVQSNALDKEVRFDVISIVTNAHFTNIEHIENAFYPH